MSESVEDPALAGLRSSAVGLWQETNQVRLRLLDVYAQIERHGVGSLRVRSLTDLVGIDLRCSRKLAREVVADLHRFTDRAGLLGETLPPQYPLIADGLASGAFAFEQARIIADTIEKLPPVLQAEHGAAVETILVEHAATHNPTSLLTLAKRITALLYEGGPEPRDEIQYRRRRLQLTVLPDGSSFISGHLTATATAAWCAILTSLAGVRNHSLDEDGLPVTGPDQLGPDNRTAPQRFHDAFEEAGQLLLENDKLPEHAGLKADLIVTIDLQDLESRTGQATTHHGGHLTVQQVLHLAAEMNLIPAIIDQELGLVQHGRGRRLASPMQRKTIFARDRGCSFPGCDRTAAQSQLHHMDEWLTDNGETNPDNLTITCGYHNNEAPRQGWKAQLIKGIPHWTPPPWQDPDQKPRRNWIHHPELLTPSRT